MVHVRAYARRDGTQVREHTRSAPTFAATGGGTGLLILLAILYGFATHNIVRHTPGATDPGVRPAAVTMPLPAHTHRAHG
ncbi:hypothetical protein ABH931_007004 [Streptacidiphilus sp. MAP12-33]|uniref:hypothetical protein n=1 Tax=Streptacidiphilus sp. MAP12-33 TaxID=3156266 RepID=UPI00351529B3